MADPVTCPTCGLALPPGATACPRDGTSLSAALAAAAPTMVSDAMIGRRVGEYVVQRAIGGGGMGVVYEALQPLINRKVAIKILRPQIAGDPEHVQRLLAEARTTNAIRHRGIIDIFDFGELEGTGHYVVMEYLEGQSLEPILAQSGVLPEKDVLWVMDEVLDALDAAHAAGIVHRDMKPSNIFIVSGQKGTKYVKVLDFGLAKELKPGPLTPQTYVGSIVGTPEYLSPEQAAAGKVGPATDLYSLGVVAYELLTGRLPFTAESPRETAMMHVHATVPRVSALRADVNAQLDALIFQMMQKKPEDRPESASSARAQVKEIRKHSMERATVAVPMEAMLQRSHAARVESPPSEESPADSSVQVQSPSEIAERAPLWRQVWMRWAAGAMLGVVVAVLIAWSVTRRSGEGSAGEVTEADASTPGGARAGRTPDPASEDDPGAAEAPGTDPAERHGGPHRSPKDAAPTRAALQKRIDDLERKLRKQSGRAEPNPALVAYLRSERHKVIEANDPQTRRSIAMNLTKWENRYLGH